MKLVKVAGTLALIAFIIGSSYVLPASTRAESESEDTEPRRTEFHWSAPSNTTGAFAAEFKVTVDQTSFCWTNVSAEGEFDRGDPIAFWLSDRSGSHIAGLWTHGVQAHAGPTADTRWITGPDNETWGMGARSGRRVTPGDALVQTLAVFGLDIRDERSDGTPLEITISCEGDPFSLSKAASRTGRSFTQESLEGGVGTTVRLQRTIGVSVDDGLTQRFNTSRTRFMGWLEWGRHNGQSWGNVTLHHPDGDRSWTTGEPAGRVGFAAHEGGPGRYTLEVDWAQHSRTPQPYGILVGLDPVESLDTVV